MLTTQRSHLRKRIPLILLALVLVPLSTTSSVICGEGGARGEASPAAENHNCRLYAAISDDLPDGLLQYDLVSGPNSLKNLAASDNIDGWGIGYYPDYGATPVITRGAETAYTDPNYDAVVAQIDTSEPKITMVHLRDCTSGCCEHGSYTIDDPDPFYRDKNGTRWIFSHNGYVSKTLLRSLIDEDYLAANPPTGSGIPECDPTDPSMVVCSELYFIFIMQKIEENGWNVVNGIIEAAKEIIEAGAVGGMNFVFSDGSTIWAFRRAETLYYTYGPGYAAVASEYTSSSQGDWHWMQDYELAVLTRDASPMIIEDIREYPSLLVYPYVGETTPTTAVISWVTDNVGAGEVRYSLDQSYSDVVSATNSVYDGKFWHSATLTGLTADTTYYYRVYSGGYDVTPWMEITFTTAPEPSASGFTFVALGDSRPDTNSSPPSQGALDVAAEMEQHSFDLALHTGDLVNSGGVCSGDDSSWNQYVRAYFDLYRENLGRIPFYPSVGNHELNGGDCGYQSYTDVYDLPENAPLGYEEEFYSFEWGNAHFVALDTNQDYSAGSPQYNWLVNDLQTSVQPWKFVFFHHPAYSSGVYSDTSEVQTHLVPVFETYGVDAVFNGHDHHYERTCPIVDGACTTPQDGGVVYYVTGGGGAPLRPVSGDWFTAYGDSLNHFLKVEVNGCWLRLDAIDTNGSVFDSYEIDHCNHPPVVGAIPDQVTAEGEEFVAIELDNYVSDVDHSDEEMAWTYGGNSELSVSIVDRVATISVPDPDWNGGETIVFTATDPGLLSDSDAVTFTVTPVNDPPDVGDIPDQTIAEGEAFATVALDDYVGDVDHGDEEMVWTYGGNSELSVSIVDRVATISVPDPDWNGGETIVFTATDPGLLSDSDAVTFTVTPVNDPPDVGDIPDQTIAEGEAFATVALDDYVGDVDHGDEEMVWTYGGNNELSVSIVDRVAMISVTDPDWNGGETIVFTATDPGLLSDSDDAAFTVTPVNDPPVANDDAYSVDEGDTIHTATGVLDNDLDVDTGDTLLATLVHSSSYGTLTFGLDGTFTYVHDGSETTEDNFTYKAYDGTDYSNVATVTIGINPTNDPPVAMNDTITTGENTPVIIDVLANDYDPDDDTLTISDYDIVSAQEGTVDCTSAGMCTYSPSADFVGTDTFAYSVSDGNGGTDTAPVIVTTIADIPSAYQVYMPFILNSHGPVTNMQVIWPMLATPMEGHRSVIMPPPVRLRQWEN
jgi:VCBS repeat-containing protein